MVEARSSYIGFLDGFSAANMPRVISAFNSIKPSLLKSIISLEKNVASVKEIDENPILLKI